MVIDIDYLRDKGVRCFISGTLDPWFNLATEDWIFRDMDPSQHILFLWRNKPVIVIGRHQNPWAECNLTNMKKDDIILARRQSGGGAVFQDLGNTNFTLLSSKENYDKEKNFQIIINALKKFDIKAERAGRNDLVINGKKFSGSAFKEAPDRAFHHGTLMINVNISKLSEYLTPSQKKLVAKGVKSLKARVCNLQDHNSSINHDLLIESIIEEFFKVYNKEKYVETLDYDSLKTIPKLNLYYDLLKHRDWRFGETPGFDHYIENHFSWGLLDLHFNVINAHIKGLKIFSDTLHDEIINKLTENLSNISYNKESIIVAIQKTKDQLPSFSEELEEFQEWLVEHIE